MILFPTNVKPLLQELYIKDCTDEMLLTQISESGKKEVQQKMQISWDKTQHRHLKSWFESTYIHQVKNVIEGNNSSSIYKGW